jgi:hypothetical protein
MIVEIKEKSVYGNVLFYPNNDVATKFVNLLGKKTFSYADLDHMSALALTLGFTINYIKL